MRRHLKKRAASRKTRKPDARAQKLDDQELRRESIRKGQSGDAPGAGA